MQGGGAQIVQQIESLLMQLAQQEPEPAIQRMIRDVQQPIEALQQVVGRDDTEDMAAGEGEMMGGPPGGEGGATPPEGAEGGKGPALVIHIGAGGPKDMGTARKAAMANFRSKGHFNPKGQPGEEQATERTRAKQRGSRY